MDGIRLYVIPGKWEAYITKAQESLWRTYRPVNLESIAEQTGIPLAVLRVCLTSSPLDEEQNEGVPNVQARVLSGIA